MSISYRGSGSQCGKSSRDAVHQAICRSVERGTVYVVAAGNESRNARLNRPANYSEVITVSAMADYDGRGGGSGRPSDSCPYWAPENDDAFADFSNYGADVDLIAPGRCVLSTYTRKRYAWMSGTSMATPHVSGAVAVYRAMFPSATPQQTKLALQAVGTRDWRASSDPDREHEKAVWIGEFRTMPDFSVSATQSSAVVAGQSVDVAVTITRVGGFTDPVSVEVMNLPAGFSATGVTSTDATAPVRLEASGEAAPGWYYLILRAASGDISHTSIVALNVPGPTHGPMLGTGDVAPLDLSEFATGDGL
jgi:subtilisin family serine protease